jgi:hypothetical protein
MAQRAIGTTQVFGNLARRSTIRIAVAVGLVAAVGVVAGSAAAVVPAPSGGRAILSFPERDFVSLTGFAQNSRVTVEVLRNDVVVGVAHDAVPQDDLKTPGVFDGLVDVNHPGGACWEGVTPNIRPGDVVRTTQVDAAAATSITEQTVTQNVKVTQPATNVPAGSLVVTVKGTAQDLLGNPLPLDQLQQRMISSSKDRFDANNRRDLRAPGDGTLVYDAPGSIHWTATYTLTAADVQRAVGSESRIMWLGANPAILNENTIYEYGQVGGPTPPCTAPAEQTVASLAPASVPFLAQDLGTESAPKTVTLTNTGVGVTSVLNVSTVATDTADYVVKTDSCTAAALNPGASCSVTVAFAPTAAGSRPGALTFTDSAAGSPQTVALSGTGVSVGATPAPLVLVDPANVSFAGRVVGRPSLAKYATILNVGNAPLTISGLGAGTGDFAVAGGTCTATPTIVLAAGQSCTAGVTFTPSATGPRTGTLVITDDAAGSPHQVALSGTGFSTAGVNDPPLLPHAIIAFPARDFVSASGWDQADLVTVEIVRHGEVVGVAPNVVPQDLVSTAGFDGIVEVNHPGGACWSTVTPDIRAGDVVRLTTDGGVSDQTTTQNITITQPATAVGPGTVEIKGSARDANGNPIPMAQLAARIIGSSGAPFANGTRRLQTPNDGALVYDAPGSVNWTATFTGLSDADVTAAIASESRILWLGRDPLALNELTIYEAGLGNGPTPPCTAPAAAPTPDATIAPGAVVFPSVTVGTASAAKAVAVTNTGTANLTISSVTATGLNAADFAVDALACSVPVAPNGSCTVMVTMTPSAEGPRTAALSIVDDAIGSPHSVGLSGTGVAVPAPSIEVTPATLHFSSGAIGVAASPQTVTVRNAGQADLVVGSMDVLPAGSDFSVVGGSCAPLPVTVTPGTTCTIDIAFAPSAIGDRSATLSVGSNAAGTPHTVALTGVALADGQVNDPPVAPHSVLVFPVRDFTSGSGYAPTDLVTVEVIRNGTVVGIARGVVPVDDLATPGFDGLVDVNHPGGGCWAQNAQAGDPLVTPDIQPGDVVRYLTSTAPATGDQTPTQHVVVTLPATDVNGTIVIKGIATNVRGGGRLPIGQLEARIISSSLTPFAVNARRLLRAPGDGTVAYDGPATSSWTATFPGLSAADRALATSGESRIVWRGRDPIALTEGTMYEFGQVGGPAGPGCTAPLETPSAAVSSAAVTPAGVTFPQGGLAIASAPADVTVTNNGTISLNVSGAVIVGPNAADFSAGAGCDGALLAPGASCTIATTFTAGGPASRTATLLIATDAGNAPHSVALTGNGPTPAVGLSAPAVTFTDQMVGTTAPAQTVTLTNTGTTELTFGLAVTGAAASDFSTAGTCTTTLAPGASCAIDVSFKPTAAGARTATLAITSNALTSADNVALSGNGTPVPLPVVSVSALSPFADQTVGTTSAAQTVTVTNTGNANLVITTVTAGGDFSALGCAGATLAPAGSCSITVAFSPTAAGARAGTLAIAGNAASSPDTVALSGKGTPVPAPAVGLSSTTLAFGSQLAGTTSATQAVTLTNTGTAGLNLTAVAVTGANAASFTAVGCSAGVLIPGASCVIDVSFTPTTTGAKSATLGITSNAATSGSDTVAISGNGVAPAATLSTAALAFGNLTIATTSPAPQTVTLTNTGSSVLTFGAAIGGPHAADFARSGGTCATTLAAGASCTVDITFTPSATGPRTASLAFTSDAPGSPHNVALTGSGLAIPAPVVSLTPATAAFGDQTLNTTSVARTVTMTNTGNANLTFAAAIGGINPANFRIAGGTCGTSLAPAASCTFDVTFRPTALGARSGELRVSSNAGAGLDIWALNGNGVGAAAPGLSFSPASVAFGDQPLNTTSAVQNLTLTNTGNAALTFTAAIVGVNPANFARAGGTCASPVAAGASCTLGLTFRPNALGARTATLRLTNNAPGGRRDIVLAGNGTSTTDVVAPVTQAPARTLTQDLQLLTQTAPVTLHWSGVDVGSGIASFELQQTTNGGTTWVNVPLPSPTATSIDRPLAPGATVYRFRVRATDGAGNVGTFTAGPSFTISAVQDGTPSIVNSGVWSTQTGSALFGRSTSFTAGPGSATLTFTGDSIAWVATVGPNRGIGIVFIDGVQVGSVDLFAPALINRRMVFTAPLPAGLHTIEVRSARTRNISSTGFRIDVDAFIVTS